LEKSNIYLEKSLEFELLMDVGAASKSSEDYCFVSASEVVLYAATPLLLIKLAGKLVNLSQGTELCVFPLSRTQCSATETTQKASIRKLPNQPCSKKILIVLARAIMRKPSISL
jgi:hypothetical protein